jgi:imidazolonepropionase-like amidohydrolase
MARVAAVLALWMLACSAPQHAPATTSKVTLAIVGATVVHPDGRQEPNRTILVQDERIIGITTGPAPAGATVFDAHGKWVVPGYIDAHVHFFQSGNPFTRPDAADFTSVVPYAQEVARNKARLAATFKVWVASGVAAVVDTGGPMWNFEVREAAAGSEIAPQVAIAGPLISLVPREKLALDDPPIIQVTSPEEARALAQRQLARHPDFLKVWFIKRKQDEVAYGEAITRATAEAAHAAGVRLLVHATELATAKAALRAGADVLVHSVFDQPVDDEFLTLARARHVVYVPTLWVMSGYAYVLSGHFQPTEAEQRLGDPEILAAMKQLPSSKPLPLDLPTVAMANLRRVWDAGITVALGTDAGNIGTLHGPGFFREAELMAKAGLTPVEVLRSATANGAKLLQREADFGDVAANKRADLVILDADPLASAANLGKIHRVVHGGRIYDPDALIASIR